MAASEHGGENAVVEEEGKIVSALVPPFVPGDDVMMKMCENGQMGGYLELWKLYYTAETVKNSSAVVDDAESVVSDASQSSCDVTCRNDPTSAVETASQVSSSVSDVVLTQGFAQRKNNFLEKLVASVGKPEETPAVDKVGLYKLPWRCGEKMARTLSDRDIAQYGEGACFLHIVRREHATEVYKKSHGKMDLAAVLQIPPEWLIPRADMRNKAVTVTKKSIHISGTWANGWSFYTVLQAAANAGMRGMLLEGIEPYSGELRVDGSFKVGAMTTDVQDRDRSGVCKVEVTRAIKGLPGKIAWEFDEATSTVCIRVPVEGRIDDVHVEKAKTAMRVDVGNTCYDLNFPFSLTKQVVTWETSTLGGKVLLVRVRGSLVEEHFFPYAAVVRSYVKGKPTLLAAMRADQVVSTTCERIVVDTLEHAVHLAASGKYKQRISVYGDIEATSRLCYWPTLSDPAEKKNRLKKLYAVAVDSLHVVGGFGVLDCVTGMQASKSRYHRWYDLQLNGAVPLKFLSKVLVQSERDYREMEKVFEPELRAGSLTLEMLGPGLDCRDHTVCIYIGKGQVMHEELVKEIWCGEGKEYVCMSSDVQPLDVLY